MTLLREFNLHINAGYGLPLIINVNQYDSGEKWIFTLYKTDGTRYIPTSGAIVGIKSDNFGVINSGTVNSNGQVEIIETQQMTAAPGKAIFELLLDNGTHGTANFIVLVEPKPGDKAELSSSDLSMIQEAINATIPENIAGAVQEWMDENLDTSNVIDSTLSISGAAADAKVTGDELGLIKNQISEIEEVIEADTGDGITEELKSALNSFTESVLSLANHVAYSDEHGQTIINNISEAKMAVYYAMYPRIPASSVSLNKNSISWRKIGMSVQLIATVLPGDTTDIVEWVSSDTSVVTVTNDGIVTCVGYGTATVTATAGSVSATCTISVVEVSVVSISAQYTQSMNVFLTTALDSLKTDLVVTATFNDSVTEVVEDDEYTLSGEFTEGTSVITVTYAGHTAVFNVVVTGESPLYYWDFTKSLVDTIQGKAMTLSTTNPPVQNETGLVFNGKQPEYATASGVIATNRTYVLGIKSISRASTSKNNRLMTVIVNSSSGADTGLMINRSNNKWDFYNRSSAAWQGLTGEWVSDYTYFTGKSLIVYIDAEKLWNFYLDGTLLFTSARVNAGTAIYLGGSTTSSGSASTTCSPIMTIETLAVYEGEMV